MEATLPISPPSPSPTVAELQSVIADLRMQLAQRALSESPTRSFIVSIGFSVYTILALLLTQGAVTGNLSTPLETWHWLLGHTWPSLIALLVNPAPYYRFQQSLRQIRQEFQA
jgi:hypothetical protein